MAFDVLGAEGVADVPASDDLPRETPHDLAVFMLRDLHVREVVVVAVGLSVEGEILATPVNRAVAATKTNLIGDEVEFIVF